MWRVGCESGAALEASGLDHGPISVHDRMHAMGLDPVPPDASLARILRQSTTTVGGQHGFQRVLIITDGDKITVADLEDEILIEQKRPARPE